MRDRPASHHHHPDNHLGVVRLFVSAVAVSGEVDWSSTLEVGAGDVVEHQVRLEAEEVTEAVIEGQLDLFLGVQELIERAVPGFQLAEVNADPFTLMPIRQEPSALAVANE